MTRAALQPLKRWFSAPATGAGTKLFTSPPILAISRTSVEEATVEQLGQIGNHSKIDQGTNVICRTLRLGERTCRTIALEVGMQNGDDGANAVRGNCVGNVAERQVRAGQRDTQITCR